MKILAYCILHTGRPYLRAALASIYEQVDHIVILYTDKPSQGFGTEMPCPDTEADLIAEAFPTMDKITWVAGRWNNEGEHTNAIWPYAVGYDWVWRFDADEVAPPGMIREMIAQAEQTKYKTFCVPFVHFWRSFDWACRDGQMPVRLMRMGEGEGEKYLDSRGGLFFIYHFGYAQPTKYIEYKLQVSGHRPEFRPDWLEKKWLANAKDDVHPVCYPGHWNAEPFPSWQMPFILKAHPYYAKEVIE